jgi:hypothetical protein
MPSVVPASPALGTTTYTIVPDVIVVYGCSDGGSVTGGSVTGSVIPGSSHSTTVGLQVVTGVHVSMGLHVVTLRLQSHEKLQVVAAVHVCTGLHVVVLRSHCHVGLQIDTGVHTDVVDWQPGGGSHSWQSDVVITSVVVSQTGTGGQGAVVVEVTVTVPTTKVEIIVVQDCCSSAMLLACVYG